MLATDSALRRASAEALGRIGDPGSASALVAGMTAADLGVRTACADALAAIGPEGRDTLERLAEDGGPASATALAALDAVAAHSPRLQAVAG